MRRTKYDWEAVKREYVEALSDAARPSLKELADKYGMSGSIIRRYCSEQNWADQATNFLREIARTRQEKTTAKVGSEQVEFDVDCLRLCRAAMSHIEEYLKQASRINKVVRPSEIDSLARALERLQAIGKLALGGDKEAAGGITGFQWERLTPEDVQLKKDGDAAD